MKPLDINRIIIEPFEPGDRVDVSGYPSADNWKVTTGTVIGCKKDLVEDNEPSLWMVKIELDNGRKIGLRPSWLELI